MRDAETETRAIERIPLGPGRLVLVVGPSGAGKDTLIAYAKQRLKGSRCVFARRVVTRDAEPDVEDHASVSVEEFQALLVAKRFALHWKAHGLYYGIPAEIDAAIGAGNVVVANVSRSVVGRARRSYANVLTVSVTAPPEVLAMRLAARGREVAAELNGRLGRIALDLGGGDLIDIMNDGPIARAGDKLVSVLTGRCLAWD